MTMDPNNRPGGSTLVLTAKSANKIQWFDADTLAHLADLDRPASTHELIRSPDGGKVYASVYGGGIFGKNKDPDRRIAVIDLASKLLELTIDVGANIAPHSIMMDARGTLWSTAELGNAVLAVDPETSRIERIGIGGSPHWIAVSHATEKLFAFVQDKGSGGGGRHRLAQGRRHHRYTAWRRGHCDISGRRNVVRLRTLEGRCACVRCEDACIAQDHRHRRRAGRGQPAAPGARFARRAICLRVFAR